ncbi:hypothetical protein ACFPJ4_14190 [Lysinimonas soli]|uniref:Lipoprotein n=1 Tax=Lysinimonas soli TaxID=1074233 RepID=A0ABW0NX11_9MICO
MTSSRRTRLTAALVLSCTLPLVLTGCFAGNPTSVDSLAQTSSTPGPSAPPKIAAHMTIASVDVDGKNVTVSGYVSGIVQNKGTCTFIATSAATKATVEIAGTAVSNVTTTSCGTKSEPIGSFSKGSWSVELRFASQDLEATSEPLALEIP